LRYWFSNWIHANKKKGESKIEMKLEVQSYDEGNAYSLFNMHSYHPITKDY